MINIPRVAVFVAALLFTFQSLPLSASSLTEATCEADYHEMLAQVENNREQTLAEIKRQLKDATGDLRDSLIAMREPAWDQEEQGRHQASLIRIDCLRAVRAAR